MVSPELSEHTKQLNAHKEIGKDNKITSIMIKVYLISALTGPEDSLDLSATWA